MHSFVGKLSRRGGGTEMVMYSEGSVATRKEIAAVRMEASADGQRRFKVILPAIDAETGFLRPVEGGEVRFLRDGRGTSIVGGSRAGLDAALRCSSDDEADATATVTQSRAPTFQPALGAGADVAPANEKRMKWQTHCCLVKEYLRLGAQSPHIIVLQNKEPKWDSTLRGYQLDFHGRAAKASEKNFQLVAASDPEKVVMLFGKQRDDRYSVDFRFPLCGLQAAAIATTLIQL
ncbi:tub family protein-like protein [Strigomonas culicis]|nr:tub family protein-like protein [Strigomonas culicis]|eukprot:EPY19030.1 tub family protein-like protein [Strigomonas culicis]